MAARLPVALSAVFALAPLSGCDRAPRAPQMNAADLSDDRGARAGRFLPSAENVADANNTAPDNAANESTP